LPDPFGEKVILALVAKEDMPVLLIKILFAINKLPFMSNSSEGNELLMPILLLFTSK
jgi:hypothetical protein